MPCFTHIQHILAKYCQPCGDNDIQADLVYCTWLYCASNIILFSQIEGLWQPCVKQVCPCHFPNSISLLCVSVPHFGTSHNMSIFLNYYYNLLWWPVISDLTDVTTMTHWRPRWWFAFFRNKVFLIMVYTFASLDIRLSHLIDYSVNITCICIGKPKKKSCDSLYWEICFIVVAWSSTCCISEERLCLYLNVTDFMMSIAYNQWILRGKCGNNMWGVLQIIWFLKSVIMLERLEKYSRSFI